MSRRPRWLRLLVVLGVVAWWRRSRRPLGRQHPGRRSAAARGSTGGGRLRRTWRRKGADRKAEGLGPARGDRALEPLRDAPTARRARGVHRDGPRRESRRGRTAVARQQSRARTAVRRDVADLELVASNPIGDGRAVLFRQRFGGLPSGHDGLVALGVAGGKLAYVSSTLAGNQQLVGARSSRRSRPLPAPPPPSAGPSPPRTSATCEHVTAGR